MPQYDCEPRIGDAPTSVIFVEDDINSNLFTTSPDDVSSLKVKADAQRGLSFELEYDNGIEAGIGFSTTTITIDTGDGWKSGQEIAVTLTDPDANTNSLSEETLDVTNPDHTIPAIKIGDPLTLAEADSVTLDGDEVDFRTTEVSDILVVTIPNDLSGEHVLNIELGEWNDIGEDYFVQDSGDFEGAFILNYDLRSFGTAADNALIKFDIENHGTPNSAPPLPPTLVIGDEGTIDPQIRNNIIQNLRQADPDFVAPDTDRELLKVAIQANNPDAIDDAAAERFLGYPPSGFSMPISPGVLHNNNGLYTDDGKIRYDIGDTVSLRITIDGDVDAGDYPIIADFLRIGIAGTANPDTAETVNDAIYRLELEEDGDNSSDFIGTLEYVGLNQINIADVATYTGIEAFGDEITLIADGDTVSVEYYDLDATGEFTTFTAEADAPTHSGSVKLDSDGYKVSDTVMVTVEDADLNTDSTRANLYTAYGDVISSENAVKEVLTIFINGEPWEDVCGLNNGLEDSDFTLRETGRDTGVFTGTFAVPAQYCDSRGDSGNRHRHRHLSRLCRL